MKHQRFPKRFGQHLLGQIITGGAQSAGGNQHIGPAPRQPDRCFQTGGVIAHHRVIVYVQPQRGQLPTQRLGVGIDNAAQKQLGSNRQNFHGMAHNSGLPLSDDLRFIKTVFVYIIRDARSDCKGSPRTRRGCIQTGNRKR